MRPVSQHAGIRALVDLYTSGRHAELEHACLAALALQGEWGLGWKLLGAALQAQGKDALEALERAAALLPSDADGHSNLGNEYRAHGRFAQAIASCQRAIAIDTRHVGARVNLANVLSEQGQFEQAVEHYRLAIAQDAQCVTAYVNLGNALRECRRLDEAQECLRRAMALAPGMAGAFNNMGSVLRDAGRTEQAIEHYRHAAKLAPDDFISHSNLAAALQIAGFYAEAIETAARAVQIRPDSAEAWCGLALAQAGLQQPGAAVASLERALAQKPDYLEAQSQLLYISSYLPLPPQQLKAMAEKFGAMAASRARPYQSWPNRREPERRLRIGFVSGDMRNHPIGYFLDGVLEALAADAASGLELVCYHTHFLTDDLSARLRGYFAAWNPVHGMGDADLAAQIHRDGIDILLDLSGHSAFHRLGMLAWKPSPIQATWLGYMGTTGLREIDYLLGDSIVAPEPDAALYTEKIWRFPEIYCSFTAPPFNLEPGPLPMAHTGHLTFGCLNNLSKMNEQVVSLWARVLQAVPQAKLLLKTKQLKDAAVRADVLARFAHHGIAQDRLILEGPSSREAHLGTYRRIDIALDPFPYAGGTTNFESLWMGVPFVTLAGNSMLARCGASIARNAGLADWIAASEDGYVEVARSKAAQVESLAALRAQLRRQAASSPLFDAARFACHFRDAMRRMWMDWCAQQP